MHTSRLRHLVSGPVSLAVRALFLFAAVLLVGCSGSGPSTLVTGKVTLDGKQVTGTVTFTGPDNKEVTSPIGPDGMYHITDPALGENKVSVKGMLGVGGIAGPTPPPGKGSPPMPGKTSTAGSGVNPPPKYASPDNGLKYTVKRGKQNYDIPLTP